MCRFNLFFFKLKTAYELRISDWSSDVCSSDLKFVPLIIGACDVMAATEIQPFDLAKKRTDERFHCCPGPVERQKILLAKRVEMQARNALQIRSAKLADRMAQTAMRLAGIIFLDFPFAVFRIDAKTDVERLSHSPCRIDLRSETCDLRRTIEDHMV